MANNYHKDHHKIIVLLVVAIIAFLVGYTAARIKYKDQLKETFDMVMSQQSQIAGQNVQIKNLEGSLKATPILRY